jgi:EF-P beta-lysylation protein EpmB
MITRSGPRGQTPAWQRELAEAIRDPATLLAALKLPQPSLDTITAACRDFPLRVPHSYLRRMEIGNPADPLLRQVLPQGEELAEVAGFITDPVGDQQAMVVPGLIHKYHGRALLTLTGACGIHCRYCFRRHFPYSEANPAEDNWHASLDYLSSHTEINELILSGGDPLSLSDNRLERLVAHLEQIPHLTRLRWHSRLPVVIPSRLTEALLKIWQTSRLQQVLVLHFNHPNEINSEINQYLIETASTGITLLNQSVLLRGVNDSSQCLAELSEKLFAAGVLPYYLHLLDRTQGSAHFEVAPEASQRIYAKLMTQLPGYLVPKLVRDLAGERSKQLTT